MNPIRWCDQTWNPVSGCDPISTGCQHCYAARMAKRLAGRGGYPKENPFTPTLHPEHLDDPYHWAKPRRIFVCSMGDLFHDAVPARWVWPIFSVMLECPRHTFMVLTKRPARMKAVLDEMVLASGKPLPPNVWLGVTAENQRWANERIPILLSIEAAKRFVSVEPMLTTVDVRQAAFNGADSLEGMEGLSLVICGAETGAGARPMDLAWARSLRDQCRVAGVPFFFKKDSAGNKTLDGKLWEEMP